MAIELDDQNAMAYANRGIASLFGNVYHGGIEDFTRAIEIDPEYAEAYYFRGLAYESMGETALADADFARYSALTGEVLTPDEMIF